MFAASVGPQSSASSKILCKKMAATKHEVARIENPSRDSGDILVEDEPSTLYEVKWRTLGAIFALSLANVCAALSNTVESLLLSSM